MQNSRPTIRRADDDIDRTAENNIKKNIFKRNQPEMELSTRSHYYIINYIILYY